ncbi:cation efflux family-domain-containing protein [Phascolomyces articulosus]|uniref:Cation efflux family-domain-containing protein n=1 Tax=Phascolomyces articulosus TaxID=60185 RepID=A0AAD5JLG3_9FUNG|nr:cation efflux family-domain-containing protein [Phascolomyces articulosus]
MSTIKSTRQFTKRRPQSPLVQHQQLPGAATPTATPPLASTGTAPSIAPVAIQSSRAPLRASRAEIVHEHEKPTSEQQHNHVHDHSHDLAHGHEQHVHNHTPSEQQSSPHLYHQHDHSHEQQNTLGYTPHAYDHHHEHDHNHGHAHAHAHDHHGHDHRGHDHHGHDHGHDHGHVHGHDDHHHHHHYPHVYVPPLPSWSEIFANLAPMQKTIFTWFLIHITIGSLVWWTGTSRDSASIVGFSYLVIFDALGVLNLFVSDIVRTNPAFLAINTKRPFAARRYEIVFAMAITVYLLFVTMYTTKESLEHLLMEKNNSSTSGEDHHHHEARLGFGGFLIMCIAMSATVLSSVSLRNHENFVRYLRRSPPTVHGFSYNVLNRARGNAIKILLSNIYSFSIVSCGLAVLILFLFGMASPFMDKFTAFGESAVMLYLGGPTAAALAKLLLQTTPDVARSGIESRILEIRQNPNVVAIDRIHFWQNTYGKCVGTLEIQVKPDADEQSVLQFVYQKLEGLTSVDATELDGGHSGSELTVSIIKQ